MDKTTSTKIAALLTAVFTVSVGAEEAEGARLGAIELDLSLPDESLAEYYNAYVNFNEVKVKARSADNPYNLPDIYSTPDQPQTQQSDDGSKHGFTNPLMERLPFNKTLKATRDILDGERSYKGLSIDGGTAIAYEKTFFPKLGGETQGVVFNANLGMDGDAETELAYRWH